ncbi:unnamed protein product [Gadus morhua 'NCC']
MPGKAKDSKYIVAIGLVTTEQLTEHPGEAAEEPGFHCVNTDRTSSGTGSLSSTTHLLFVPGKEKRQVEDGDVLPYCCATLRPGL